MTAPPVSGDAGTSPTHGILGGFGSGVAWTYLSVLLSGAAAFFLAAWSIRRVGTAQYGQFALVLSLTTLLTIFDYALGLAVQRASARVDAHPGSTESAEQRGAVQAAHGAYLLLGLGALTVTVVASIVVGVLRPGATPYLVQTVALLGAAVSLQLGSAALPAVVLGCRRFNVRSGATLAGVAVRVCVALLTVGRFGVGGLALAQLVGMVVERVALAWWTPRHIPWFVLRPARVERAALRGVLGFALPLLVLNVSAQLFTVSDLVVLGALVGASAVGTYQVGALLPVQVAGFIVVGYNVVFPSLSRTDDEAQQEEATAFLTRFFAFVGGAGLGLLALMRHDVVDVMLGRPSTLAADVVAIFCAVCMANLILHGPASVLIARGHQRLMARVVTIELPVNLVLTVWFVLWIGPVGAALATLATVLLMDFVVFPLISRGRFARPALQTILRHGVVPAALGSAIAGAATPVAMLVGPGAPRLLIGGVAAAVLTVGAGLLLLRPAGRATLRAALRRPAPVEVVTAAAV